MNPLVTGVKPVEAPRTAAADEYFSNWYEITEIITWGFGLKKKISFKGCFHDQPWGMQSHVFAPMGTEMRNSYRIGGNQPGEPRESRELGVDTPLDGLYLREDININCAVPLTSGFVKKEMKDASKVMIDRMRRKAELLDEGKLHAMWEDGKLKTAKPSGEPTFADRPCPSPGSPPGSPPPVWSPESSRNSAVYQSPQFQSPALDSKGYGRYHDLVGRNTSVSTRSSAYIPPYQQQGYQGPDYAKAGAELPGQQQTFVSELPGSFYQPQQTDSLYPQPLKPQGQVFRSELPGDTTLHPSAAQDSKPSPPIGMHPAYQQRSSPQPSPQPSPRLPQNENPPSLQTSNSSYQITNPDQLPSQQRNSNNAYDQLPSQQRNSNSAYDQLPSQQRNSNSAYDQLPSQQRNSNSGAYESSVQQWQRNVQGDQPINSAYYRNSRPPDDEAPDHQRFSKLSIQQNADDAPADQSRISKCPVCGIFEGDEAAVSHHVSKAHFN